MNRTFRRVAPAMAFPAFVVVVVGISLSRPSDAAPTRTGAQTAEQKADESAWTTGFRVEKGELASVGRNDYFVLQPGYQSIFEDSDERLVITVLDDTKMVDGVQTRVVEEFETKGGELVEISRNYFAISKRTNSIFYFGEDVDIYKNGKISSHEGGWLSGVGGAKFGLMMPGQVLVKGRYYQEIAPGVAMDRAEVVTMQEKVKAAGGELVCVKMQETTPLEPGDKSFKYYAPGIGLAQDGMLKLVKHGQGKPPAR